MKERLDSDFNMHLGRTVIAHMQYFLNTNRHQLPSHYPSANHPRLDIGQDQQYRQCLPSPKNTQQENYFKMLQFYTFTIPKQHNANLHS